MPPSDHVIEVNNLSRRFDSKLALDNVSLKVEPGQVFGLIGENAAGKTTLIKHLLGLLKPHAGTVRVFGLDPVADPVGVLSRIGYLSEDRDLPRWMRVHELLRYSQALYSKWDARYAEQLQIQFALDPAARIKTLSRGETARLGLLVALAHRPDLLLLDEPSSGLDPVVRRDILEAIIRSVIRDGRTVFFSSHLLDEIERASDQVAMLVNGRVVLAGPLHSLRESHRRLTVRFESSQPHAPVMEGALSTVGSGHEWTVICNGDRADLSQAAAAVGGRIVEEQIPSLDEIFVAWSTRVPVRKD